MTHFRNNTSCPTELQKSTRRCYDGLDMQLEWGRQDVHANSCAPNYHVLMCYVHNFSWIAYNQTTYLTMCTAYCTMVAWVMLITLLVDVPPSPRSNTSIHPFSVKVNKILRLSSMLICTMGSSSPNARFRNDGMRNERALVEWFTFLQRFPNQLPAAW